MAIGTRPLGVVAMRRAIRHRRMVISVTTGRAGGAGGGTCSCRPIGLGHRIALARTGRPIGVLAVIHALVPSILTVVDTVAQVHSRNALGGSIVFDRLAGKLRRRTEHAAHLVFAVTAVLLVIANEIVVQTRAALAFKLPSVTIDLITLTTALVGALRTIEMTITSGRYW